VSSEEEVLLLYEIIATHGSAADFEKLTKSAIFSPSKQFSQGSKEVLLRAIAKFKKDGNWKAVFDICESSLSQTDEAGKPTLLASDLVVWKEFITAASYLKLVNDEYAFYWSF
jgi:N-terminal acetyltransferase B complex non-catalytic subunit